jgi:hypothetical protein
VLGALIACIAGSSGYPVGRAFLLGFVVSFVTVAALAIYSYLLTYGDGDDDIDSDINYSEINRKLSEEVAEANKYYGTAVTINSPWDKYEKKPLVDKYTGITIRGGIRSKPWWNLSFGSEEPSLWAEAPSDVIRFFGASSTEQEPQESLSNLLENWDKLPAHFRLGILHSIFMQESAKLKQEESTYRHRQNPLR